MNQFSIEIGTSAGEIWRYLNEHNETAVWEIKSSLNMTNSKLFLALGWLLREDKILLFRDGGILKVKLK